jgi:hypothetical protein
MPPANNSDLCIALGRSAFAAGLEMEHSQLRRGAQLATNTDVKLLFREYSSIELGARLTKTCKTHTKTRRTPKNRVERPGMQIDFAVISVLKSV